MVAATSSKAGKKMVEGFTGFKLFFINNIFRTNINDIPKNNQNT
jgi:hypothetical protein